MTKIEVSQDPVLKFVYGVRLYAGENVSVEAGWIQAAGETVTIELKRGERILGVRAQSFNGRSPQLTWLVFVIGRMT